MASISSTVHLSYISFKLTQRLFVCSCRGRRPTLSAQPLAPQKTLSNSPSLGFFRNNTSARPSRADGSIERSNTLSSLSAAISTHNKKNKSFRPEFNTRETNTHNKKKNKSFRPEFNIRETNGSFFPEISDKAVGYWLLGSAASVFGIVVFGGLTRLTESGYDL